MKRIVTLLAACLIASPSFAGGAAVSLMGAGGGSASAGAAYVGPGDVVSGAAFWWGLRSYSRAYATGSNKAVTLRRASDNTTQDILITGAGDLDVASASSFAGTDATCTGTISSTTLTCTGASGTPHAGSTLSGVGITQPSFIVSCGTFTGGAGTCTLNAAQTVSVGETITMTYGLFASKLFDQTGNGNDIVQATAANQPQLIFSCLGALPCLNLDGSRYMIVTRGSQFNEPGTVVNVFERTSHFTTTGWLDSFWDTGSNLFGSGPNSTINTQFMAMSGAVSGTTTASDSAWHVLQAIFNVSSSLMRVDNTDSSTFNLSTGLPFYPATAWFSAASSLPGNAVYGMWTEGGTYQAALTTTQRTNLCTNENGYWSLGVSC